MMPFTNYNPIHLPKYCFNQSNMISFKILIANFAGSRSHNEQKPSRARKSSVLHPSKTVPPATHKCQSQTKAKQNSKILDALQLEQIPEDALKFDVGPTPRTKLQRGNYQILKVYSK